MGKTLLLEKRGCDFFNDEDIQKYSDVGNYRVGLYNYSITGKDGVNYTIEFTRGYKFRFHNKRTGAPLKKAIREHAHALCIDTQYTTAAGCYRNLDLENEIYSMNLNYTKADILKAVNHISIDTYDSIEFTN